MDFIKLVNSLERSLNGPLPGRSAQERMAPMPLEMERFDEHQMINARKGAVLMLLCPSEDRKSIIIPFIKRATYEGVHSGQIALPGGKKDLGDRDLGETALRETEEEIGVSRKDIQILGNLSDLYIPPSNFSVRPFIGYSSEPPIFEIDEREVDRLIICSFDELTDEAIIKKKGMNLAGGYKIQAPYYEINEEVVWGATAMILSEFLTLWKEIK
ncbi:NUDIX hydrolase [Cyclobacterium qasimii]|uniref:Coenzyme A pyrophosphatase n=2 Tax=Cyclobacterium qasimii TaxID=1350429 RepID=A0A512CDM9_9BACT|nr:CoA pyrophosphatase [Cyclobacterium qasimii]EPR70491.1 putative nudix hydrolase YeaB [Cyclobacterium qasimii M12-11B]GEO22316.1 coenzyme A pyrophosphatase [Cyclobacterium qasimii]